jgi:hypothetical protein
VITMKRSEVLRLLELAFERVASYHGVVYPNEVKERIREVCATAPMIGRGDWAICPVALAGYGQHPQIVVLAYEWDDLTRTEQHANKIKVMEG